MNSYPNSRVHGHREHGYVLVAVLVLLLGAGAGLLNVTLTVQPGQALSAHATARQRTALINARQSLISYATVYPYLYGPAGAGPAHFPCPDTDGFTQSIATSVSGLNQRRDGPNPPCVSVDKSQGQLPRHTALPGHRYLFHAQPEQQLLYEVDGQVINNPVNRVVNLSTLQALAHSELASVHIPSERNDVAPMKIGVSAVALIETTTASVAAWVMERSNRQAPADCLSPVVGSTTVAETINKSADDKPAVTELSSPGASLASTIVGTAPSDKMQAALAGCLDDYVSTPDCPADVLWLQLLDYPIISGDVCIASTLKDNLIEGVPALRHWFVRNLWQSSVILDRGESCVQGDDRDAECRLVYPPSSRQAISTGADLINLQWVALP